MHMITSYKHLVLIHNAALQTLLTDKPLEHITYVNNVIYATALPATLKLGVKTMNIQATDKKIQLGREN